MERIPAIELTPAKSGEKIYVRLFSGVFRNLRRVISWPLLAAYFGLVWLQWDGAPVLLFSFEDGRLYFFGTQWGWQDLPVMAGILIIAAIGLFAASALIGRVWCGMACPQSIWTWMFLAVEEFTEGSAWNRRRADREGLTLSQWIRRFSKHLIWGLLALWTAITFTGYFVPVREILTGLIGTSPDMAVWGWVLLMGSLTYLNAGLVREKICLHACPYSRFQSTMFDDNTRTVSYDAQRGEGGAGVGNYKDGDCINCKLCVQVCPTGIDIREGLQAACIDCGACIDACDSVMNKLGRARGLIGYRSHNILKGLPSPFLNLRSGGYVVVFSLSLIALIAFISLRPELSVAVTRDRQSLYQVMPDDTVCNSYDLEVDTFAGRDTQVHVRVEGLEGVAIKGASSFVVREVGSSLKRYQLCVDRPLPRKTDIEFIVRSDMDEVHKTTSFFYGQ